MNKKAKRVWILILAPVIFLAACPPGTGPEIPDPKTEVNLTAPVLQFDNATGILSWAPVANAAGYVLTVNENIIPETDFALTPAGDRYEYTLSQFGEFSAAVKAVGHETATHIYKDATSTVFNGEFTAPEGGQKINGGALGTPSLQFDNAAGIVHWAPVLNALSGAEGYTLLVNDSSVSFSFTNGRYEYQLPTEGPFTAKVTAKGHETATHIYDDSAQASKTDNYTIVKTPVNLAQPVLQFDKDTGIIFWNPVANAKPESPYTLLVNDINVTSSAVYKNPRYEYQLPTEGTFTAKVTANGYETETHIYNSATSTTLSDTYVKTIQPLEPIGLAPVDPHWGTPAVTSWTLGATTQLRNQSIAINDRFGEWETQTQAQADFATLVRNTQTNITNAWGSTAGTIPGAKTTVLGQIDNIINEVKNIYAAGGGDADMLAQRILIFQLSTRYNQRAHDPNPTSQASNITNHISVLDALWGGGMLLTAKV